MGWRVGEEAVGRGRVETVEQMARVERLEEELGREQDRLRAMLSHLTQGASQGQV